ncbi:MULTISPECIES: hypothetical protein [unclassified Mycobacterium]|uniref:hypothetical protein n=1 Tax=unclassified Mycobacterium TaxID=2642494 RepID=UPI0029C7F4D2|nr:MULTISPECIES: hypothetical protein [unclassified Mycobacterium]
MTGLSAASEVMKALIAIAGVDQQEVLDVAERAVAWLEAGVHIKGRGRSARPLVDLDHG